MIKKDTFIKNVKDNQHIKTSLMVMRRLYKDGNKVVYTLSDKSGYIKGKIPNKYKLHQGMVIEADFKKSDFIDITDIKIIEDFDMKDYLPTVARDIDEMIQEMEDITSEYVTSYEGKLINDYFFKNEDFLEQFKSGIGGVSMHHNYIGGLLEHTLNVMYITKVLCDRYDCRRKEVAILAAKLHDIGKLEELEFSHIFKYTLKGELQGHIVIGVQMLDKAFREIDYPFSEDFEQRLKACIVQHHGKLEYGSPRECNMEESYILNLADGLDATMNKITTLKETTQPDTWSEYDRRLETKMYL